MKTKCDGCGKDIIGNYHKTFKLPKQDIVLCEYCEEIEPVIYGADWQCKECKIRVQADKSELCAICLKQR